MTESQSPPALPYDEWEDTKATLHLASRVMGKVKLMTHPKQPHWWHVTLRVTPRGVSTGPIVERGGSFVLELDVHDLRLEFRDSEGVRDSFDLQGTSIAEMYRKTMDLLRRTGHETEILARPYDDPHSETRFTGHRSPSFGEGGRRSDVEAYSHEVISFGYWPGDPDVRFPAYYSYTAPEPAGLSEQPLQPDLAWWQELPGSHMALLKYDDVRGADDPRDELLAFLESAYGAGVAAIGLSNPEELGTQDLWSELDERFPTAARGNDD